MAENLTYYCPTKIYFVEDGIKQAGEIIRKETGVSRIFIVYGSHSLKDSGNLEKLHASLKASKIRFKDQGGVSPNPDIQFVRDILPLIRKFRPQAILAVGGGSVLDTAKSICASYYYDGDPIDFNMKKLTLEMALPLVTIPTISAAGSEMSDSCVMSDYKTGFKGGFNNVHNRPLLSIEDPSLTYHVPEFQTCCGLVDILSHSFERFFSPSSSYEPCDYLALGVMKNIVDITPVLLKEPANQEARRSMQIASTVSHNGFTSFGKKMVFKCHFVEHQLSGKHPSVAHGLGLRFIMPEFLEVNKEKLEDKIVRFGKELFHVVSADPEDSIRAFSSYLDTLPLPKCMKEIGISEEEEKNYISQLKI
jgi:alcohol dehydrogenase YqhD (iron-dependent ADH family)